MHKCKYKIIFYKDAQGKCPIELFLDELTEKMRAKVVREMMLLEEFGKDLRLPHSCYVDSDIFELRIKLSSNIVRIFYFFEKNQIIILTNGYIKKQNKLSKNDFNLAVKYKNNYRGRVK